MKSKIFWKFFFSYLFIIFLSLLGSYFFLKSYLSRNITEQSTRHLTEILTLVRDSVEGEGIHHWSRETVDPLVDRLSQGHGVRITWIDPEGVVLGDSDVSGQELLRLENHRRRPEVEEALKKGFGESIRYSSTVKMDMLYVARPFKEGILRVSMPLAGLTQSVKELRRLLGLGLLGGALVSLLGGLWMARYFSKPLRDLTGAVGQMAEENFRVRVPVKGNDEMAVLSRNFNELSSRLKEMVERLSEEKSQLRVILDSMVEGVMVLDPEGRILLANPALRGILDLETVPTGKTPMEVLRSPDLQKALDCMKEGKECVDCEVKLQRKGERYFLVHGAPLKNEGRSEGIVLVFQDITHLRRLENVRKEFVANVSHELKTPLTAIKGYTETLLHGALKDEENSLKFLKIIDAHAERLKQIMQDLLDLSKIESEQYELRLEKVPLLPLFEDLKTTFEKTLEEKKIRLRWDPLKVESIWADESALRQVLNNLVDNAVKYSNPGSEVRLHADPLDHAARFCVEDNGPGIPTEHLPRIFERFYRVDPSRSRQLGGTGLGLSIVKHLVKLHGGEVWAESILGQGSKFYFTLPQKAVL